MWGAKTGKTRSAMKKLKRAFAQQMCQTYDSRSRRMHARQHRLATDPAKTYRHDCVCPSLTDAPQKATPFPRTNERTPPVGQRAQDMHLRKYKEEGGGSLVLTGGQRSVSHSAEKL